MNSFLIFQRFVCVRLLVSSIACKDCALIFVPYRFFKTTALIQENHKRPQRAKALFYAPIRLTLKHLKSLQCNANKRHRGGER